MEKIFIKLLRKIYSKLSNESNYFGRNWKMFPSKEYSNQLIYESLISDKPTMIARLGANELACMVNYLGVKHPEKYKSIPGYIKRESPAWWWEKSVMSQMCEFAGFFPKKEELITRFCLETIHDMKQVDILGSWLKEEFFFNHELNNSKSVMLEDLEPFFSQNPWTRALKDKKVLVVHPFADTIEFQYKRRELIFKDDFLPIFDLKTIKAVQSIGNEETPFDDWFEALESMKRKIEITDFDICIIGCGAYGFSLAAYVKSLGKKAIHLGGVTQLLFGIKGARWEQFLVYPYKNLYNEFWVRPGEHEKPKNADKVENACYW